MKKAISFFLLITFLVSCGEVEDVKEEAKKSEFYVNTKLWSEFSGTTKFIKIWQVSSSQDIDLSSNANGRLSSVRVKPWDSVFAGQVIATLEDNIWNYGISLERASIWVERAEINYESQKINLDKAIFDAEKNLSKLTRNLEALKQDTEQNLLQAEDNLNNSKYDGLDSRSALQLEQLDNNIEKARLDYEIKLTADNEQIASYGASLRRDFNALQTFLDDIIEFSDEILWVTDINRSENDDFEMFLWAEDVWQKRVSENALRAAINYRDGSEFSEIDTLLRSENVAEDELIEIVNFINQWYELSQDLLSNLEQTLYNTTPSVWEISEAEINAFTSTINGFQASSQWTYGAFISFWTGVKSFLKTYKDNQASILKGIELQQKDRDIQLKTLRSWELSAETSLERTRINSADTIKDLELQIETAENNLENAKKNKEVTLRSLSNSISNARVDYNSAAKEYGKLTITSPINGTVSSVEVDAGQEVFSGTSLFSIVSDKTPEVEVSFSAREKDLVSIWQEVSVMVNGQEIIGSIYSISDVADENLNYISTIVFTSGTSIIWNLVSVNIPISTDKMLVPLNILTTQWDDIAVVKTLSGTLFEEVRVRMGDTFGDYVEVVSCAENCDDLKIITNDVSNFDENKFIIVEK